VGYFVTFRKTNYDSKKGLVWDLTVKHRDISLHFEAICRHPSSKTNFLPKYLKPDVVIIYPDL